MKQRYFQRQSPNGADVQFFLSQGVPNAVAQALCARGVTQQQFADMFRTQLHNPLEMKNMPQVAETFGYILEQGGSVLICGDYDADGLTASAILSLFLTDNGVDNDVLIPTREEGYGLHAQSVVEAFQRKFYDLVVTVDCGISNAQEVQTIVDQLGTEVIVTDHHELPEQLPACLCINPKLGYPFAYLSGAGVAWKLVEALAGRQQAEKYSLLAAIGTIGDLMPLTDENRTIVQTGLVHCNHASLKKLAEIARCSLPFSATDIAMKIAPRINAAGRMGNPQIALHVLLGRDAVCEETEQLEQLNQQRKEALALLNQQADQKCDATQIRKDRLVFLHDENWQHGILGIAAARCKEKFGVPAVVLAGDGEGGFVGSARGVEGMDLFELFVQCKQYLTKFGGHKAAVGFSVSAENLAPLKDALVQQLAQLDQQTFCKQFVFDAHLDGDVAETYNYMQQLQPMLPQDKLLFHFKGVVKMATAFGKDNSHLSLVLANGMELKSFGKRSQYAPFVRGGADVEGIVSLEYDDYNKRVFGVVEDLRLCNSVCFDQFYQLNLIRHFEPQQVHSASACQVQNLLAQHSVLAVFDDYETYLALCLQFDFSQFYEDIFFDNSTGEKTVAISPEEGYDFGKYANVVYFCKQGMPRKMPPQTVYFCVQPANESLYSAPLSRQLCKAVYGRLKAKDKFESLRGLFDKYLLGTMQYAQYVAALRVFEQLNFVRIVDKFTVEVLPAPKTDLQQSSIFCALAQQ